MSFCEASKDEVHKTSLAKTIDFAKNNSKLKF